MIINPLIIWLWIGWIVLIAGSLIALLPDPREEHAIARIQAREGLAAVVR